MFSMCDVKNLVINIYIAQRKPLTIFWDIAASWVSDNFIPVYLFILQKLIM